MGARAHGLRATLLKVTRLSDVHGLAGAERIGYSSIFRGLPDSADKEFIRGLTTWVFERTSERHMGVMVRQARRADRLKDFGPPQPQLPNSVPWAPVY